MDTRSATLAIVGGGASGVSTLIAAIKQQVAETIYIIDPLPIGRGTVFSNRDEDVLCNTSIAVSSIERERPRDLLDYVRHRGHEGSDESFIPRVVLGDYLEDRLSMHMETARKSGIHVIPLAARCRSISPVPGRAYQLHLSIEGGETSVFATDVAICLGYGNPVIPGALNNHTLHPSFIGSPYPEERMLSRLADADEVLIIGTKLSAVDAAVLLCRDGHKVTMVSSSGELPAVRSRYIQDDSFTIDKRQLRQVLALCRSDGSPYDDRTLMRRYLGYFAHTLTKCTGVPWQKQFSTATAFDERLREEIALVEQGHCRWQDVVFKFVETVNTLYLDPSFDGRFGPVLNQWFGRYLTPVALPNAKKMLHYIERGAIDVQRGNITEVTPPRRNGEKWKLDWGQGETRVDAVVCAAGFHHIHYSFGHTGELVIGSYDDPRGNELQLAHDLSVINPMTAHTENIWFVGVGSHKRAFAPNALYVMAAQADSVVMDMAKRRRSMQRTHAAEPMRVYGTGRSR